MVNRGNNDFMPAVAIAPGKTIRENMKFLGMNQKELAARLGITEKHLCNILSGNAAITYETALRLESVIGPSAKFWMNLETNYQLNKARLEEQANLEEDLRILKEIPYDEMSKYCWVKETKDKKERVLNCREFFRVSKLSLIKSTYEVAFRTHKHEGELPDYKVLAWLRESELEGLDTEVQKIDKKKLEKLIPIFRELTLKSSSDFYPEMKRLCAECGVALVLIPYISKTYICGAVIWRDNREILALSGRGKRADVFWFTFFHELAHLINHSGKRFHIGFENDEDEADGLASNYLIPEDKYREFIDEYDYTNKDSIISYAYGIGIAPFMLLGRLLHEGYLEYKYYRDLIPDYELI